MALRHLHRWYPVCAHLLDAVDGTARKMSALGMAEGPARAGMLCVISTGMVGEFVRERLHALQHGQPVSLGKAVGDLSEPLGMAHGLAVLHRSECPSGYIGVAFPWQVGRQTDADRDALRQALKRMCVDEV